MIAALSQKNDKIAQMASSSTIQTKLTIGASNDKYEREANHIMRMPQTFSSQPMTTNANGIQRKCAKCENEDDHIQRKSLMMKSAGGASVATPALGAQLNSTKGSGSPLPAGTNNFMSNAFGSDFSNVRVHTNNKAQQMNQGLNARAFTHGSDIYFNKGQYSPGSSEGRRLLGHELTHVVQQNHQMQPRFRTSADYGNKVKRSLYSSRTVADTATDRRVEPATQLLDERGAEHIRRQTQDSQQPQLNEAEKVGYTQCDFIHDRIDVDAQKALYYLYKKGGAERSTALRIWAAIRNGNLSGIYQQDRKVPALKARDHNKYWWTMITDGAAMVFPEKEEKFPEETSLLVYKKSLAANIAGLALNLHKAWFKRTDIPSGSIPDPSLNICPTIASSSSDNESSTDWEELIPEGLKDRCQGKDFDTQPFTDKCGNTLFIYCKDSSWHIDFIELSGKKILVGKCVFDPAENRLEVRRGFKSKCFSHVRHRTESRDQANNFDGEHWQHTETDVRKGKGGAPEGWCRTGKKHPYDWTKSSNGKCLDKWW